MYRKIEQISFLDLEKEFSKIPFLLSDDENNFHGR